MPGPSTLHHTFKAKHIFTDREKLRGAFANALGTPQGTWEYRILNFHGMAGLGETALCKQFTLSLEEKKKDYQGALTWAKLDFDFSSFHSAAEGLLEIRQQLAKHCDISFPTFDMAFHKHFHFIHQGADIHAVHPALFKQPNDILQDIKRVAGDLTEEIPGSELIYKYLKILSITTQQWWQRRGKEILNKIDTLEHHKLLEKLPSYLSADISNWLTKPTNNLQQRRLIILLDTYEALWRELPSKTIKAAMFVDAWIQRLAEETPGVLLVILGRDKLAWNNKCQAKIESHLLSGLSNQDAEKFLKAVPVKEGDIRQRIINNSTGIPFYLDLQVDQYESLKNKQKSTTSIQAKQFGDTGTEILPRFSNHLDEARCHALEIVSPARFINETLANQLIDQFLGDKTSIPFKKLTDYSFWKQQNKQWSMHSMMRDYLQTLLKNKEPELFKQINQFLFDYYNAKLDALEQVTELTEEHEQALTEAGYHLRQLDSQKYPGWICRQGQLFLDTYQWDQLEPLLAQALVLAEQQLGKEHHDTATVLHNMASLYHYQGKYKDAEPLYQRSLRIREKIRGKDHPDVASSLNNLALLYDDLGNHKDAESLYQRSLKIREIALGEDNPDVAESLNNLALLYDDQGKYKDAESLYKRSLDIREKALGENHSDVASSLNNLAGLYYAQGKYKDADPLLQRAITILKKLFPDGHPHLDLFKVNYADMQAIKIEGDNENLS